MLLLATAAAFALPWSRLPSWTSVLVPWESACAVAAIVAVEVIISLAPVAAPDSVITRRVLRRR
jgi:hypothetical protein